jgi:hypothetical protein
VFIIYKCASHTAVACCMAIFEKKTLNDPSAGSPTDTLLRLLLPLNDMVNTYSRRQTICRQTASARNPTNSPDHSSVGATGGVYKGQGRNQRKLMTCAY